MEIRYSRCLNCISKLYIEIPEGLEDYKNRLRTYLKVTRALYGTVDAPKLWSDQLSATLTLMGYKRAKTDWNIFIKQLSKKNKNLQV